MRLSFMRAGARCLPAVALVIFSSVIMFSLTSQRVQAAHSPVRIMFLGDSITGSPGCWREILWNHLQSTGYTNIDFVGTLNDSSSCGVPFDGDNEGHAGYLATNIANQNLLPGWLSATNPDIVAMHLGTNDAWGNTPVSTILAAYSTLVSQMRANNPKMIILVAQITPMNPASGCNNCTQDVANLDNAIPGWAATVTTAQSPVIVVDQFTGYNDATDTYDGVHPNSSGNQKIADRWYPPLTAQLNTLMTPVPSTPTPGTTPTQGTTPTPSPTQGTTPTPSPTRGTTPTPVTGGTCKVAYVVQNQWPGGFTANVTITNTGSTALAGWTLAFTFPDSSQKVSQGWSAAWSQSGQQVTATSLSWNSSLAAGASTSIGFNGTFASSNPVPSSLTLNGTTCTEG